MSSRAFSVAAATTGLLAATALAGCSSDRLECGPHASDNPETRRCEWRFDLPDASDTDPPSDVRDTGSTDPLPPSLDTDRPPDAPPPICDHDGDGEPDPGIDCKFFAHGGSRLYKVDPVTKSVARQAASNIPDESFLDMDIHPDGDLWAITSSALYHRPKGERAWRRTGQLSGLTGANGMAIDNDGTAYVTMGNELYRLDLEDDSGRIDPRRIGRLGGDYRSSGDCVIRADGTLLMTSRNPDGGPDILLEIDRRTGRATEVGTTDHHAIWGMTIGWNNLYGTTSSGDLILIDPADGSSTTLHTFPRVSFNGAASTPASRRRGRE